MVDIRRNSRRGGMWFLRCLGALGIFVAGSVSAQIPSMPGMPSVPGLDPAEMQRRLQEQMIKCQTGQGGTGVFDVALCKTLGGLMAMSTGQNETGISQFRGALSDLEAAGDRLGRVSVLLMMGETAAHVGDSELSRSSLEEAIEILGQLHSPEAAISRESLHFFARFGGIPEEFLEQLESMMSIVRPMLVNQFELQIRLRLVQHLLESATDEAEPHLEKARQLSGQLMGMFDAQVFDFYGQLRQRQGRMQEARDFYRQGAEVASSRGDEAYRERLERRLESLGPAQDQSRR